MELEVVKIEAKIKVVDIYREYLTSVNAFLDQKGYLTHPHLSVEAIGIITEDMTQVYESVCDCDNRTLVSALKDMLAIMDLHMDAMTIIRSYTYSKEI